MPRYARAERSPRARQLTLELVVWALVAMNLYTTLSMGHVLHRLAPGLRYAWPAPDPAIPGASALSYRRYQRGVRPLACLFRRVCQPLTTAASAGAFRFGLRLLALDGTLEDVPDTPANARAFGRQSGRRGQAAFPQVLGVYLAECGSHASIDAGCWPCHTSERVGGRRLLRSVGPDSLVMWDCNFHSYAMLVAARHRGAHVLGRLPRGVKPRARQVLADGSTLVELRPAGRRADESAARLVVRLLTYTLTDPACPGHGEPQRLVTTLLDPTLALALDLSCAYHERWEVAVAVDALQTHQRPPHRPLRSQKPLGVLQELYALLLAHYAVRALMHQAATQAGLDPDRLSFVHAVRLIHAAIPEFQQTAPVDHPRLYRRLLRDLAAVVLPQRRSRSYPRVVKRTSTKFHRKRPEHAHWPQPAGPFRAAVALI